MNGVLSDLPVSGAKCVGDPDINAAAHADQKSYKQCYQQRRRADRSKCLIICKPANNSNVA